MNQNYEALRLVDKASDMTIEAIQELRSKDDSEKLDEITLLLNEALDMVSTEQEDTYNYIHDFLKLHLTFTSQIRE